MSANGVPVEEATAKDFMMVRAKLVKRLGGANEALVWTRIDFRASSAKAAHQTEDGSHWWAATYEDIAEETGLSVRQARGAVESLVRDGYLRAEQQHGFRRTRSYTPVIAHLPDSADDENDASKCQERQIDVPDSADVPLIETRDIETITFDDFWSVWPRKEGKRAAEKAWSSASKRANPEEIIAAASAYARSPHRPEKRFVPHASTWLNGDRWDDPAPSAEMSGRGASAAPTTDEFAGMEWAAYGR